MEKLQVLSAKTASVQFQAIRAQSACVSRVWVAEAEFPLIKDGLAERKAYWELVNSQILWHPRS